MTTENTSRFSFSPEERELLTQLAQQLEPLMPAKPTDGDPVDAWLDQSPVPMFNGSPSEKQGIRLMAQTLFFLTELTESQRLLLRHGIQTKLFLIAIRQVQEKITENENWLHDELECCYKLLHHLYISSYPEGMYAAIGEKLLQNLL